MISARELAELERRARTITAVRACVATDPCSLCPTGTPHVSGHVAPAVTLVVALHDGYRLNAHLVHHWVKRILPEDLRALLGRTSVLTDTAADHHGGTATESGWRRRVQSLVASGLASPFESSYTEFRALRPAVSSVIPDVWDTHARVPDPGSGGALPARRVGRGRARGW